MSVLDPTRLFPNIVASQYVPDEGPKAIPLVLDFADALVAATGVYTVDLRPLSDQGTFRMLQTVFIDMSNCAVACVLTMLGTGQQIIAKPNTQGYYQVLAPNPVNLSFSCLGGTIVKVFLLNAPVPGCVWPTV